MAKRVRGSKHDAPHGGPRAKVDARVAATVAEHVEDVRVDAAAAVGIGDDGRGVGERGTGSVRGRRHVNDHGRVEDPEPGADFARLRDEIDGIVELVERHEPGVRREIFDSYVTAVTEFGATASQLASLARETDAWAADDAWTGDDDGSVDEAAVIPAPRSAASAVHGGRSGVLSIAAEARAGDTDDEDEARRRRRRRDTDDEAAFVTALDAASPAHETAFRAAEGLVARQPPRTNVQRNALIALAFRDAGLGGVSADDVSRAYGALGWRAPANVRASLRAAVRRGALDTAEDGRFTIADAEAARYA
ncbi:hypothetical protein F8O01_09605 [Pseudoclavibacter chungangensis]|uniref:Uncharacterized protein n=1 Tax=Pseudoclavibacter chungangensis TaxID=587635 RepID=A0A7J5BSC7_9MICO|nr:hypothetical protein [Pseudoclavibacter chungangensis]KAB1656889.1 hypothetical protein F8O01_09605 [Pseudoclavibacter chungangensis]NYJ67356.1 hypothetical protein [Pseudoclavibacter chungangensis]